MQNGGLIFQNAAHSHFAMQKHCMFLQNAAPGTVGCRARIDQASPGLQGRPIFLL